MQPTLKTAPKVGLVDLVPILISLNDKTAVIERPRIIPKSHHGKILQEKSVMEIQRTFEAIVGRMTLTDIAAKLGTNENTTYKRLVLLMRDGKISRTAKQPFFYTKKTSCTG